MKFYIGRVQGSDVYVKNVRFKKNVGEFLASSLPFSFSGEISCKTAVNTKRLESKCVRLNSCIS